MDTPSPIFDEQIKVAEQELRVAQYRLTKPRRITKFIRVGENYYQKVKDYARSEKITISKAIDEICASFFNRFTN